MAGDGDRRQTPACRAKQDWVEALAGRQGREAGTAISGAPAEDVRAPRHSALVEAGQHEDAEQHE
jgi:hypothetical protein